MHVDADATRGAAYTQLAGPNQMGKIKEKTRKKGGGSRRLSGDARFNAQTDHLILESKQINTGL